MEMLQAASFPHRILGFCFSCGFWWGVVFKPEVLGRDLRDVEAVKHKISDRDFAEGVRSNLGWDEITRVCLLWGAGGDGDGSRGILLCVLVEQSSGGCQESQTQRD